MIATCTHSITTHQFCLLLVSPVLSGGNSEAFKLLNALQPHQKRQACAWIWTPRVAHLPESFTDNTFPFVPSFCNSLPRLITYIIALCIFPFTVKRIFAKTNFLFTHYATYPFMFFVKRSNRYIYIQDLEWLFIPSGIPSALLRSFIVKCLRNAFVIVSNSYLEKRLIRDCDIFPIFNQHIWASDFFFTSTPPFPHERTYDLMFVARKGAHKRLDLYISFLTEFYLAYPDAKVLCIATSLQIARNLHSQFPLLHLEVNSTQHQMKLFYLDTRIFLLLSDHEGFALPPLEALGNGCIPFCRACGGPSLYMKGTLESLLFSLDVPVGNLVKSLCLLLHSTDKMMHYYLALPQAFLSTLLTGTPDESFH